MVDDCWRCGGEKWVCEKHRTQPFNHDDCGGAGEPCPECNTVRPPMNPPGFEILCEVGDDDSDVKIKKAEQVLASLRWKEDMLVTNDFGERVYLGPCYNSDGERIGITDCCFADDPCEKHRGLPAENGQNG